KNQYTDKEEVVTAKVLSNNGGPIFQVGNDVTFGHPGRILFPGVPENLIAKPTLVWLLNNSAPAHQKIEASYLTGGITWRADYVVTLNDRDDRASLGGWVTIDNKSGGMYQNARVKLVAGDINRVKDEPAYERRDVRLAMAAAPAPQFKEEEFFEYHIYTLQRPSTIKDNQIKQISFVEANDIPVAKELVLRGDASYYWNQSTDPVQKKIGVFIEISNKKEQNLGMPLPKGIVRAYKQDKEGSLQFVGEDKIEHTPKDEKIRIKLGDAFDVVATRKQTDWKKSAKNIYESSYEVSIRNHKKEDVTVKVIEPIPGDWSMLNNSHEFRKTTSHGVEFIVPVPKDKEATLTYSVRMKF
ncbi:MAG TPA: DUF4139 domain-containing protein, partial [Dissulfurispiraceae bacterium]|nr:DUF4139 domain-containing protein [Dissulfurispiraceae bacterium]